MLALCFITATQAQSIVGKWEMSGQGPDGTPMTSSVTFKDDGKLEVDFGNDGTVEVQSTYTMDGNKVSLKDLHPDSPCYNMVGIYEVTITDDEMTAKLVEDPCETRRGDGSPMTMKRL